MFSALKKAASSVSNAQVINFGNIQVLTTGLLAEGGYSYVYSAREVGAHPRLFAVKKMVAQDEETRACAEMEVALLQRFSGTAGFVKCYGASTKTPSKGLNEYHMLLEYCPNGSLIDLVYKKTKSGEFEKRPPLPVERMLDIFEMVAGAVAHMHAQQPPVAHRDLKLENVLGAARGLFVLCDFGSATTRQLPSERSRREVIEEEERISKYSTLMYRAPEMVDLYRKHDLNEKVDVWALGCILFTLAFQEHPFSSESSLQVNSCHRPLMRCQSHFCLQIN